jgi:hypothetical protein
MTGLLCPIILESVWFMETQYWTAAFTERKPTIGLFCITEENRPLLHILSYTPTPISPLPSADTVHTEPDNNSLGYFL